MTNRRFTVAMAVAFVLAGCSSTGSKAGSGLDTDTAQAPMEQEDTTSNLPTDTEGPLKNVYFAFDSSALTSVAQDTLKENGEWVKANPNATFVIEGHCDERGTNEYNLALGERRAKSVYAFYKKLGIAPQKMSTISYGEEVPVDPAHTEEAWTKNRRAHHKVTQ